MALANTLDVAYWLSMCVFTFDLDHFIDQVMQILLSTGIFTIDIGPS